MDLIVAIYSNQLGGWSTKGLTVDKSQSSKTFVTCLTTHLTSFAVLVSIQDTAGKEVTMHGILYTYLTSIFSHLHQMIKLYQ